MVPIIRWEKPFQVDQSIKQDCGLVHRPQSNRVPFIWFFFFFKSYMLLLYVMMIDNSQKENEINGLSRLVISSSEKIP